jgi:hypothetical protein
MRVWVAEVSFDLNLPASTATIPPFRSANTCTEGQYIFALAGSYDG